MSMPQVLQEPKAAAVAQPQDARDFVAITHFFKVSDHRLWLIIEINNW